MVGVGQRSRVHFRAGHCGAVLPQQWIVIDRKGTPIGDVGLQVHVQREVSHGVVGSKLLLQMREHRVYYGAGREPSEILQDIRGCPSREQSLRR